MDYLMKMVSGQAQVGAWDAPWHRTEDANGWETVYRGTGQHRHVKHSLVLDLTPEQWAWACDAARVARVTPHTIVKQLIDSARAGREDSTPPPTG